MLSAEDRLPHGPLSFVYHTYGVLFFNCDRRHKAHMHCTTSTPLRNPLKLVDFFPPKARPYTYPSKSLLPWWGSTATSNYTDAPQYGIISNAVLMLKRSMIAAGVFLACVCVCFFFTFFWRPETIDDRKKESRSVVLNGSTTKFGAVLFFQRATYAV